MTDISIIAGAAVVLGSLASHAFHSWLRQRERERLSATDKAALEKRMGDFDNKLLELKNTLANVRSR